MASRSHLGLKMLVEHLANATPEASITASDTALDHMIGQGDVHAVMATADLTPERRDRFIGNVLKLIQNDAEAPVDLSVARLIWVVPALQHRESTEPSRAQQSLHDANLFEHLATFAMLNKNFDAQIALLGISNNLPPGALGMLEPISYMGLSAAVLHAVTLTQNAMLDDPGPLERFVALADVAAIRCNYAEHDQDFGTMQHLRERVASMTALARKLNMGQPTPPDGPSKPPAAGRRRNRRPRRDNE